MTKTNILVFICLTLAAIFSPAQTASPAQAANNFSATAPPKNNLPTPEEIDSYMKRSFGYDPSLTWQVIDIKDSSVPGIAEVVVSINRNEPYHFFFVASAQTAFVGQEVPFGPNPYASARAKLQAASGPSRGPEKPAIQIVEFSDLECPHCKVAQPIMEKLVTEFPQVRYTFQQFPLPATLHPWAMKAAEYADCAAQADKAAFWKYVDAIFDNQNSIALATADDKLKELATSSGLDANKVAACAASPDAEARVNKSVELGHSLGLNQTPSVFINGRLVLGIGSIPENTLKSMVQFEIDHAGK